MYILYMYKKLGATADSCFGLIEPRRVIFTEYFYVIIRILLPLSYNLIGQ